MPGALQPELCMSALRLVLARSPTVYEAGLASVALERTHAVNVTRRMYALRCVWCFALVRAHHFLLEVWVLHMPE